MSKNTAQLDSKFFTIFGAWFNVDLIDLNDRREVMRTAGVCASDLMKHVPDTQDLIHRLSVTLSNWNSKIVLQFINATDTDWLYNQETEQQLKEVLREIVRSLQICGSRQEKR